MKDGKKTSEFWQSNIIAVAGLLMGLLSSIGVVSDSQAAEILAVAGPIVAALVTVAYGIGRVVLKVKQLDTES